MLSFDDARARLIDAARALIPASELVATVNAVGRVLATDLVSTVAVPPLDNSAMDGYALRCADLPELDISLPVSQRIAAGSVGVALAPGSVARIFTGAPVPPGADAVVMQEHCVLTDGCVRFNERPHAGQNIRRAGEDIAVGTVVLPAGTILGPAELGVAAAVGAAQLPVRTRLRVALFSTGDELVMPGQALGPGQIYNSNRTTLHTLLLGLGCEVSDLGIVPDSLEATRATLRSAAQQHDLIVTSGGVSVGEEDHVKAAVAAEGEIELWTLAIKPGKPLAYGRVRAGVPAGKGHPSEVGAGKTAAFIGLPGNPVSSFVTFLMLVRPFIRTAQAARSVLPKARHLRAEFDWPRGGRVESRREFLRVRVNDAGHAELFPNQGSGVLTSCVWADGLVDNPPGQVIRRGDEVSFLALSELLQ